MEMMTVDDGERRLSVGDLSVDQLAVWLDEHFADKDALLLYIGGVLLGRLDRTKTALVDVLPPQSPTVREQVVLDLLTALRAIRQFVENESAASNDPLGVIARRVGEVISRATKAGG